MGLFWGLGAALAWGVSDFFGSFSSRRAGAYQASFFLQVTGFAALNTFLIAAGGWKFLAVGAVQGWRPWMWAVAAGLCNTAGSLAFYRSLEVGTLSIVMPITSSFPALTLIFALLSGERVTWHRVGGIFTILAGVILASTSFAQAAGAAGSPSSPGRSHFARGVGFAVVAALGFAAMFWILGFRVMPVLGAYASVWMLRLTSLLALALIAVPARQSLRPPPGNVWWLFAATGLLDTAAFLLNNSGLKTGEVAVVTVLASLYSAVTVFLAWIILRERLERSQWAGVFLIFAGIVLVSL